MYDVRWEMMSGAEQGPQNATASHRGHHYQGHQFFNMFNVHPKLQP